LLKSSLFSIFSQFKNLGQANNIKNQASVGQANFNPAFSKIGIKISSLALYIS
jgi:hypothetical protein